MIENKLTIYVITILSMLFWGMSFIWTTIVFKYYPPITTVFIRLLISTILLFAGLYVFRRIEKIKKEDYKAFLVIALFNPFFYFLGESYGLKYSSSTISAIFITTIPIFTSIVAFYSLHEKLSLLNIAGMIVSFAGVIIFILNKDLTLNTSLIGILLLLAAVASAVGYGVLLKKLSFKYSAVTIIANQNLIGVVYFLPLFFFVEFEQFVSVKLNFELISSLLALAVFCSSLAFIFFTIATREIGISRTSLFSNLIPVFTAIFSYYLLEEYFNIQKVIGISIVVAGLFLSQVKRSGQYLHYSG